jgi:hypothetical protein
MLVRLMCGGRRWIEVNPLMPVYKGRDGRRSGIIAMPEGEVEGSRPMALRGSACLQALEAEGSHPMALGAACANLRSRRGDGFGIIIAKTRGACVIAIIWLGQGMDREQHGLKKIIVMVCESASVRTCQGPRWPCI